MITSYLGVVKKFIIFALKSKITVKSENLNFTNKSCTVKFGKADKAWLKQLGVLSHFVKDTLHVVP